MDDLTGLFCVVPIITAPQKKSQHENYPQTVFHKSSGLCLAEQVKKAASHHISNLLTAFQ